ncbi:hypothetical protein Dimus_026743, partial [Dionaea muscipula]
AWHGKVERCIWLHHRARELEGEGLNVKISPQAIVSRTIPISTMVSLGVAVQGTVVSEVCDWHPLRSLGPGAASNQKLSRLPTTVGLPHWSYLPSSVDGAWHRDWFDPCTGVGAYGGEGDGEDSSLMVRSACVFGMGVGVGLSDQEFAVGCSRFCLMVHGFGSVIDTGGFGPDSVTLTRQQWYHSGEAGFLGEGDGFTSAIFFFLAGFGACGGEGDGEVSVLGDAKCPRLPLGFFWGRFGFLSVGMLILIRIVTQQYSIIEDGGVFISIMVLGHS